ncbi:restriction endonuclease subunit S [Prevotella bivia]|uniref:restriction endonuclease subunit S n=1 Tax=Prevotella bivia TaxID=28125 RepID=UPI00254F4C83|nr:restriction endonuclease subunit S [Prevotella bivia]MDZ3818493.1 restriction endonuclease subunit S [Prevotella bivia]
MANSSDTPHYEHINFALPKNWQLSTLGEVFYMHAGKNIVASEISSNADETYRYKCIGGNGLRGYVQQFNTEGSFPIIGRQGALCGNINYVEGRFYATEHAVVVDTFCKTNVKWAFYFLIKLNLNQYATATAQPGLSVNTICDVQIPLPPLTEQQRIVAEIERWFALIDTVEQGKADLQTAIKQTKSKILDLAIHGKLVPQDPNDEPASELLKRINPKAQITCDNEHSRKLPYNWSCISHNSIIELSGGSQPPKRKFISKPTKGYIRLFQIRDYGKNPLPVYIPNVDAVKQTHKGDILLARYGGSLGKVFIAENGAYNVAMTKVIFKQPQLIDKMFAFFYYHSRVYQDKLKEISRTAQAGFNSGDFEDLYFPLPPLAEQKRIVRKIEDLFTLINIIEMELAE